MRHRRAVPTELIKGHADEGYGEVADAFRRNFSERRERGAACAVYRDGQKVVDLWGGFRDRVGVLPWEHDTLVTVFSTTKGMVSMALALAHSGGLFDLDERVATYWPEFGQQGKDHITVRQLLSHQAGLPIIDVSLELDVLDDPDALGRILAAQAPRWEPGTRHGYHGQSLGLYESQLIRRVDPTGRTVGRFFAEELARRLDLEFYIGLPDDVDPGRLAQLLDASPARAVLHLHQMPPRLVLGLVNSRSMTGRVFRNPRALAKTSDLNRRELLRLELPSVNGTGQVRSIAKAYGCFATGGTELGLREETIQALEEPPRLPSGGPHDRVLRVDTAYSFGFMKPCPILPFGSSTRAYGHTGSGGSFAFADPDAGVGYAYAMTRMGYAVPTDPRELALRQALYEAIG